MCVPKFLRSKVQRRCAHGSNSALYKGQRIRPSRNTSFLHRTNRTLLGQATEGASDASPKHVRRETNQIQQDDLWSTEYFVLSRLHVNYAQKDDTANPYLVSG